ncbi:MAG: 50S ribosomal protein L34e [Thermoprotei archaeon]|nr:MAG: 50S ribosomal protein L34e [Thermoprotei archaeon]
MPRPALRSRSLRRVKIRTPGGLSVVHYERRKHSLPKCALCKRPLRGIGKLLPREERKGVRMPTRPYGGYLCHKCLENALKRAIRG